MIRCKLSCLSYMLVSESWLCSSQTVTRQFYLKPTRLFCWRKKPARQQRLLARGEAVHDQADRAAVGWRQRTRRLQKCGGRSSSSFNIQWKQRVKMLSPHWSVWRFNECLFLKIFKLTSLKNNFSYFFRNCKGYLYPSRWFTALDLTKKYPTMNCRFFCILAKEVALRFLRIFDTTSAKKRSHVNFVHVVQNHSWLKRIAPLRNVMFYVRIDHLFIKLKLIFGFID